VINLRFLSLQGGDDFLVFFGTSYELGSCADNVPGFGFVGSEGRVLGMMDG